MTTVKVILTVCSLYFFGVAAVTCNYHEQKNEVKIEKVAEPLYLSEGPYWDVRTQKLYYVDLMNGHQIIRYDPSTGQRTYAKLNAEYVGVVVPVRGTTNKLLVAVDREVIIVTWDGKKNVVNPPTKILSHFDIDHNDTRVNDGKCDAVGRFWVGSMAIEVDGVAAPNKGSVYKIEKNGKAIKAYSPVTIGNGLTWSLKNDVMYYIDTPTRQIWAFDFKLAEGTLSNKRVVFDLNGTTIKGIPDGMTNDDKGNLWVALFDGQAVIQIDPKKGKLLRRIELPVDKITSVAFGGPKLEDLYVTTARKEMTTAQLQAKPDSGAVFRITGLGVRGLPAHKCRYNPY